MQVPHQSGSIAEGIRPHLRDLAYGDFQARWDALKWLANYGEAIVEPLLEMLQDEQLDWEARWFAARGLAAFDRPEIIEALLQILAYEETEELRLAAGEALSQIGPSAVNALSSQLHRPEQRKIAVTALTRIHHPAAIAPLLQQIADPDPTIRQQVVTALGTYRQPEVSNALMRALRDQSAEVRIEAVKAVAVRSEIVTSDSLIARLEDCLADEDLRVVTAAIAALGRFPTPSVVALLQAIMADGARPEAVSIAAARSLGWMETAAALEALATAEINDNVQLQAEVIAALGAQPPALSGAATMALLERLSQLQERPRTEPLLQDLALAFGRLGDKRAVPALEALSAASHEGVRLHAQAALRQLGVRKD